jgi:exonuclease SbcD
LEALRALPERTREPRPILEVGVALEKPQAMLRATLLEALEGKGCILGRIDQQRTGSGQALGDQAVIQGLKDLPLEDVFRRKWAAQFKTDPGPAHLEAFHELHDQVNQEAAR